MSHNFKSIIILLVALAILITVRQLQWNNRFCQFGELLAPNSEPIDLGGFRFTRFSDDSVQVKRISDGVYWYYDFSDTLSAKYQFGDDRATLLVNRFSTIPHIWYTRTMCVRVP